jgi:esterase/lipase
MSNIIYGTFPTEKTLGHHYSNKSKILVYISFGLGCGGNTKNKISKSTKIDPKNIIILCHKTSSALKTIGQIYTGFDPLAASNYVDAYTRSIISNSIIYEQIFVFGFSFGGAIVNRVAEELNKNSLINNVKSKIFMATFGSIYIPNDKGVVPGIRRDFKKYYFYK